VKAAHLKVEWSLRADGILSIIWTESGGPPTRSGTLVVQEIVKGELNGQAHFDWRADSYAHSLWSPL
jgi:hypothetical protein